MLGAGVALSVAAAVLMGRAEDHRVQEEFARRMTDQSQSLEHRVQGGLEALFSIRDAIAASGVPDRRTFRELVWPGLVRHPEILAPGWVPQVPREQRAGYEARARADGVPRSEFIERDPGLGRSGELAGAPAACDAPEAELARLSPALAALAEEHVPCAP